MIQKRNKDIAHTALGTESSENNVTVMLGIVTGPWQMNKINSEVKFKKFRTKNKPNANYDFGIRLHEKRINNLEHKLRRKSNRH